MLWEPIWLLPNISMRECLDSTFFALVSQDDERVIGYGRTRPKFRELLTRFTDAFGVRLSPALIMLRVDAPQGIRTIEAASSFRDILIASSVLRSRTMFKLFPNGLHRLLFSNYFRPNPWMTAANDQHIYATTPAILSLHDVETFNGQSSPDIGVLRLSADDFEIKLFRALSDALVDRYINQPSAWQGLTLFRSLNMMTTACDVPSGADHSALLDAGRQLALWVAAIEILLHPNENGEVNIETVFKSLTDMRWHDHRLTYRRYKVRRKRRNLACSIYNSLYKCRNGFLHGNPVHSGDLRYRETGEFLFKLVAPLYRLLLSTQLGLEFEEPPPPSTDLQAQILFCFRRDDFFQEEQHAERAILNASKLSQRGP